MIIQTEIKDNWVLPIGQHIAGFQLEVQMPTTIEEAEVIITNFLSNTIEPFYNVVIEKDPQFIVKKQELDALVDTLKESTKKVNGK
mgnify:CR=1 FL=1